MKKYVSRRTAEILIASAVLTFIALVFTYLTGRVSLVSNAVNSLSAPLRTVTNTVSQKVEDIYAYIYAFDSLKAENEELKKTVSDMEEQLRLAESYIDENASLKELLKIQEESPELQFQPAKVTVTNNGNWGAVITIDKGTVSGISKNMCVVTETGYLVGKITEVGLNWSTVLTILDGGFSVSAMVSRSGQSGLAEGNFELMSAGKLKLNYISDGTSVLSGDTVITTGAGGIFPENLEIGKITDVKQNETGAGSYAVIEPSADISSLKNVYIITNYSDAG